MIKNESQNRRIIGVDPGLAASGWGIIDSCGSRAVYVAHGCIQTEKDKSLGQRLLDIYTEIEKTIALYKPAAAAIEKLFFSKNVKTAMPVGEARGVLTLALVKASLHVFEFSPNQIKQTVTGVAHADKRQVQEMTRLILRLDAIPRPDHAADALAAAICASQLSLSQN
ncbi:MAG: crossover junction endodeoxyribonuclease RuvC [Spirochaetaceae bacterium]|jgi:crossover junction endodeoxyribonuclease RuvC|nr:crossover junction endodeoxyribonuclease RuvC [Spirochaetaceae bacterium]